MHRRLEMAVASRVLYATVGERFGEHVPWHVHSQALLLDAMIIVNPCNPFAETYRIKAAATRTRSYGETFRISTVLPLFEQQSLATYGVLTYLAAACTWNASLICLDTPNYITHHILPHSSPSIASSIINCYSIPYPFTSSNVLQKGIMLSE